ncbi:MAG: hypothetical protein KC619_31885 [Myxococcales bacterium]|nr:hypothetical protein [Myxococcales bacterium]
MTAALPIVWLAGRPGLAHAFLGRAPGTHERLAATKHPGGQRGALCGAWMLSGELRTEGGARRRCKSCQRSLANGSAAKWMIDAITFEAEEQCLTVGALLGHTTDRRQLVGIVERDRARTFRLAAAIARNAAREHLPAIEGADYFRRAVEEAAIAIAVQIAARLEREAAADEGDTEATIKAA